MKSQPPDQLTHVGSLVEDRLATLFASETARWASNDERLAEAVSTLGKVVNGRGKRLRAAFCYWAWHGTSWIDSANGLEPRLDTHCAPESLAIDAGAGFELMHAFALIHDDVMDDSSLRRGEPTVHVEQSGLLHTNGWRGEARRYGEGVAILLGDLSHVYADQMMASIPPYARAVWDELRIELNLGQYLDLRSAAAAQLDPATAAKVSLFKSALYTIVRPLQLGAMLSFASRATPTAPASPPDEAKNLLGLLDRFGRPLGRAFQLKDDLLGLLGHERDIGKPVGDDLREGKPTELLAVALQRAGNSEMRTLSMIGQRELSPDQIKAIVAVMDGLGAIAEIEARIDDLVSAAVESVPDLPFNEQAMRSMGALAHYVGKRDN